MGQHIRDWPLMWRVLRHVIDYPEGYDQGWWWRITDCGTTRCIAGWAAHFAGYREPNLESPVDVDLLTAYFGTTPRNTGEYDHLVISPYRSVTTVDEAARRALGAGESPDVQAMFGSYVSFGFVLRHTRELARDDGAEEPDWLAQAIAENPLTDDDPDYHANYED